MTNPLEELKALVDAATEGAAVAGHIEHPRPVPRPVSWEHWVRVGGESVVFLDSENEYTACSHGDGPSSQADVNTKLLARGWNIAKRLIDEAWLRRAAQAEYEATHRATDTPAGGLTRWATWDEAAEASGFIDGRLVGLRAALAVLIAGEEHG